MKSFISSGGDQLPTAAPKPHARRLIGGAIICIILAALVYTVIVWGKRLHCDRVCLTAPFAAVLQPNPVVSPQLEPDILTGKLVASDATKLHPLAVMIENHPDARPQSGLAAADLVYEAIAEGGITRFMAVYADPRQLQRVGPVRSARTYYIDWATELGAFYAHVGGSEPALAQIAATHVFDLNQFTVGAAAYARDSNKKVALEHTMYSSTDKLWKVATVINRWPTGANFAPWLFRDDVAETDRPASQTVKIDFSTPGFAVNWTYDMATSSYSRTMAGKPHLDAETHQQIVAKTIILQTVERKSLTEAGDKQIWQYTTTGSNKAVVIENGQATAGTWKRKGTGRTRFYDQGGNEIPLVRGTIWVEVVHPDTAITISALSTAGTSGIES